MGGEKLKTLRPYVGLFLTALLIVAGFFVVISPLSAQVAEPLPVAETVTGEVSPPATTLIDETTIIFDDPLPVAQAPGGAPVFVVIRMVIVLALAALAIYGVVFFIKRISRPQENRDPHLKVLARVPLSTDSYAAVISLGGKAWLVGGSSGGVNLISEIEDVETLETLLLDDARRNAGTEVRGFIDFQSLLQRFKGNAAKAPPPTQHSSLAEKLREQRERLRGL